jgi:hypothetical protein
MDDIPVPARYPPHEQLSNTILPCVWRIVGRVSACAGARQSALFLLAETPAAEGMSRFIQRPPVVRCQLELMVTMSEVDNLP